MNETIERLEQKCDDLSKQYEDVKRLLEQERRKNERIQESGNQADSAKVKSSATASSIPSAVDNNNYNSGSSSSGSSQNECSSRHISGSASEPENEEV